MIAAYMDAGYTGMLSIENEDPLLSGEVGVTRSLSVTEECPRGTARRQTQSRIAR